MQQVKISYDVSQLKPVVDEQSFKSHLELFSKYRDEFDRGEGDIPFNKAGMHLHKLYFENLREFRAQNKPLGRIDYIISTRYGTYDNFVKTYMDTVNKLQGSGWVFMNTAGYLNIIPNNRIVDNIGFLVDFWEHSYYNMFRNNREQYALQHLNIINWDVVNQRIHEAKIKKER